MHTTFNENKFKKILRFTTVITKLLFIISIIGLAIFGLMFLIVLFIPKDVLTFDASQIASLRIEMTTTGLIINLSDITGSIALKSFLIALSAMGVFQSVVSLTIIKRLRSMLIDVKAKQPFSKQNSDHLVFISILLIAFGFVMPIFQTWLDWTVIHNFNLTGLSASYTINWLSIFVGFLILVLAYIFQYGAYLQDEVDQTV